MFQKDIKKLLLVFLFSPIAIPAQNYAKQNWVIKEPFEQKVFVENNEGQFDGQSANTKDKVYYTTSISGLELSFTATGLTYKCTKAPKLTEEQREEQENVEKDSFVKPESYFFSLKWLGTDSNVQIIPVDEVSFYYCYPVSDKHTTIAHAFKKLLYKNLYQGIDVEYSFPEDKKGVEYSIIVHANADLSKVKLLYPDALVIKQNEKGDIEIRSSFGQFINSMPEKVFYEEDLTTVSSSLKLNGKEITFNASNYDKNKTLIIDPWVTNPLFSNYDAAYDLRSDYQGNIYVYGNGDPSQQQFFQLEKLNGNGAIQWKYTSDFRVSIGDLAVDPQNGTIFISGGAFGIAKINTAGIKQKEIAIDSGYNSEIWKMDFDDCNNQIIIGGGGTHNIWQGAYIDTNLNLFTTVNFLGANLPTHDISLLVLDQWNGYSYMATAQSGITDPFNFNNVLAKCPIIALNPVSFIVNDYYSFVEGTSISYVENNNNGSANGFNGAAVSPSWLYLYDGAILKRIDKNSGTLTKSMTISGASFACGGLAVDPCDNIYVGNNSTVMIYDSSFNQVGNIPAYSTIYDLRLGRNGLLYFCGNGFVASYSVNSPPVSLSIKGSPACSGCNGTAYVTLNSCYTDGATYLWSNGQTNQVATGLCGGTYSVTVMQDCIPYLDSINIVSSSDPAVEIPNSTITQVSCIGEDNGSAKAIASGGTPPFTYDWLPTGTTGPMLDNVGAGNYSIIVTDANGCAAATSLTMDPKDYELFIPDAFSPNGDGQNDKLYVRSNCIKSMQFMIFDRWGNKMFETNSQETPWDGTYNGKPMNTGTYVYYLTATMYNGSTVEKKGNVTLVR